MGYGLRAFFIGGALSDLKRVVAYIDGFNLYHSIRDLGQDHLKWLDLSALVENFAPGSDFRLCNVFYVTAYAYWRKASEARHRQYTSALAATGVTPIIGRFKEKDRACRACGATWTDHEEKESDVSLGLLILLGAVHNHYDRALLLTRDSDLVPAIRMARKHAPTKDIVVVSPDWYRKPSDLIHAAGGRGHHRFLKKLHIERSLLPAEVRDKNGVIVARRPVAYDPPSAGSAGPP